MKRMLLALLLALAACQSAPPAPTVPPEQIRNPTLPPPPDWIEAAAPIGRGSMDRTRLLGRLDQPATPSTVFAAALAPDGTRLAGLNNEQVLAWDLITGELVFQTARAGYTRLFYAPDKSELYTLENTGLVDVLNAETGAVITGFTGYQPYSGAHAYDPDNGWFAFGGLDGALRVWDTFERRALVTIEAHTAQVTALAFSRDGALLVSADVNGVVRLWDWATRTQRAEIKHDDVLIGALAVAPGGSPIAVGTNIDARLWLPDENRLVFLFTVDNPTTDLLMFTAAGDYLLGGSGRGLFLWATSPAIAAPTRSDVPSPIRLPGVTGNTVSAAFSPDGALLATAALDQPPSIWDMTSIQAQTVARGDLPLPADYILRIVTALWTPDSRLLLLFDASGSVLAWGIGSADGTGSG